MAPIRPVILSGGSGTRLWPLSTAGSPKQFAALIGDRSMFALTLERLVGIEGLAGAIIVTGGAHLDLVSNEVSASPAATSLVIVEPEGRNTAPAALAAALSSGEDDILVILPSDHLVIDETAFREAVEKAVDHAATGSIVTFGVRPSRPEAGYGYLELGEARGAAHVLAGFIEKPPPDLALSLVSEGNHLWNSGVFVVRADTLIAEAGEHCPEVLAAVRSALPEKRGATVTLDSDFASSPSVSLDHAIMEKTTRGIVLPVDVGWSDVGSYQSLLEALPRDERGNHLSGDVVASDLTGSYVVATSRQVVVVGVDRMVVVEAPDVVLVIPLDRAQDVRDLPARAESR